VLDALGAETNVVYPILRLSHGGRKGRLGIQQHKNSKSSRWRMCFPTAWRTAATISAVGINVPDGELFHRLRRLQETARDSGDQLRHPRHAAALPPTTSLAAIEAGKHCFIEKPCAVDAPGVRMVMEAGKLAAQKNLGIVSGTQRRHLKSYNECIKRIQDGALGEMVYGSCYWNGGVIWTIDRKPEMTDMEWQMRNWGYFTWLSGDHIVEQHLHNIDIMRWVIGQTPGQGHGAGRSAGAAESSELRPHLRSLRGGVRVCERR
jgi:hypothetical protein